MTTISPTTGGLGGPSRAGRPGEPYFRAPKDRKTPRQVKRSSALRFYHEVLALEHLHYGLWHGEAKTLAGLRQAQQRYADRLAMLIPQGVHRVLDVGSGTGAFSRQLNTAGYEVEGLSPDPYQGELYLERVERPFHLGRFQEFEPAQSYDLVLMSESSQYIWLEELCTAVRRCVDDGYWLLADYFLVEDDPDATGRAARSGHSREAFLRATEEAGFELEYREDITEATLPTLALGQEIVRRYVDSSLGVAADALRERRALMFRIGKWLFGGRIRRERRRLREAVDPETFARLKRYEILRFRVPPI